MAEKARIKNSIRNSFARIASDTGKSHARVLHAAARLGGPTVRGGFSRSEMKALIKQDFNKNYNHPQCERKFERTLEDLTRWGMMDTLGDFKEEEKISMMPQGKQFYDYLKETRADLFLPSESPC